MDQSRPSVSVIMPALHAAGFIGESLEAIRAQTYDNVTEVVVASGDPETTAAVQDVIVVENPDRATPTALNLAIAASTGDVVVRCDAQAVLPPDYIEIAVDTLQETGADVVGGMQIPVGYDDWSRAIAAAMRSPFGAGDARYRIGGDAGPVETVYLGVFKRASLERVGGFDEKFARNQDYELNHRILSQGGVIWFDPALKVSYRPRNSLRALARQYFEYGSAKRQFARKHRNLKMRQLAPPLLVAGLSLSLIASIWIPLALLAPVGYAGSLLLAAGFTDINTWRVAVALGTMHISWGLGFIRGR